MDYAKTATQISQLADQITPHEGDEYADTQLLIVYHLRCAASQSRLIAASVVKKEDAHAAT